MSAVSTRSPAARQPGQPELAAAQLDEQIQWEAEQHIPFDIKDVQVDYQVLRRRPETSQMDLLLVAAKRDQIEDYAQLARSAKLKPVVCDIDAFTVQNLFDDSHPEYGPAATRSEIERGVYVEIRRAGQ